MTMLNYIKVSRALTAKARHDNPKTILESVFFISFLSRISCA